MYETYAQQEERETVDAIVAAERSSTERAGYRRLVAKYAGACDSCNGAVAKGETILYNRRHELRLLCLECGARADAGEELEHNGPPRMTHRERLEARAERRRSWAASRSAAAEAAHTRAHELAGVIPFGQPVHGARDRNYRDRIGDTMRRGFEHGQMADRHAGAADELERALRTSIYDDDPDAIERLEEKLGRLEAKREAMKVANAAYRKEHRAELAQLGAYDRNQAVPHAPYELQNLGGNITRTRQRLERLRRQKGA